MKAPLIGLLCLLGIGHAAEAVRFPIEVGTLQVGIRTYEGAKIVDADAIGVKVVHDSGTARVAFRLLPEELSSRFEYDRQAELQQAAQEAANAAVYEHQAVMAEMQAELVKAQAPQRPTTSEIIQNSQRANELHDYIYHLKSGIIRAQAEIAKRNMRADQTQVRSYARGGWYGSSRAFRGTSRAIHMRMMTIPYQEKIAQARLLIERAEGEISRLEVD